MKKTALIAGVTGIVGANLAEHLVAKGWDVAGLARNPGNDIAGVQMLASDLLDRQGLERALGGVSPSHVFFATWSRNATEAENIHINGAMMQNLLDTLHPKGSVQHFALVTGLKHFIGPFEMYAQVPPPPTPFRETLPRLNIPNFYYTLEDMVFAAAQRDGFGWSVHRPHTLIGHAKTSVMNMGTTLAVYGTIARETGRPFIFPGNHIQWNGLTDVTDARILAKHLEWAATEPKARNQALHVTNGDVFRWNWMWPRLADWFGVAPVSPDDRPYPLEVQMADAAPLWANINQKYGLRNPDLNRVASFWHTDADLNRPFECVTDMSKSRSLGFTDYLPSDRSFIETFERLRAEKIIP